MTSNSCLINRLAGLKAKSENSCSVVELLDTLKETLDLAERAIDELVSTELAIDRLLQPAPDGAFYGDEGIK